MATDKERYDKLIDTGFSDEEAEELQTVPLDVPYFQHLIEERNENWEAAKRQDVSRDEFIQAVQEEYDSRDWKTPWDMLRAYEDEYKTKYPAYESPWVKRQRDKRKEARQRYKEQRDEDKYPRGRAY